MILHVNPLDRCYFYFFMFFYFIFCICFCMACFSFSFFFMFFKTHFGKTKNTMSYKKAYYDACNPVFETSYSAGYCPEGCRDALTSYIQFMSPSDYSLSFCFVLLLHILFFCFFCLCFVSAFLFCVCDFHNLVCIHTYKITNVLCWFCLYFKKKVIVAQQMGVQMTQLRVYTTMVVLLRIALLFSMKKHTVQ